MLKTFSGPTDLVAALYEISRRKKQSGILFVIFCLKFPGSAQSLARVCGGQLRRAVKFQTKLSGGSLNRRADSRAGP